MTMDVKVKVETAGPLTTTQGERMLLRTTNDIEDEVGDRAEGLIHARLGQVLQQPTGRFQSTINQVRSTGDVVIDGEGTVYGRWLEGVGSRNRTTRFKGYATFRRVDQQVQGEAGVIADHQLDQLARRL